MRFGGIAVQEEAVVQGLATVRWPARFQRWEERTIIDGAHNLAGASVLAETWREQFGDERATIILAVLRDKDVAGIWRALTPIARRVILPHARSERALAPSDLARIGREVSPELSMSIAASFNDAFDQAQAESGRILITGSLHFAGEALATLGGNMAAFEECSQ